MIEAKHTSNSGAKGSGSGVCQGWHSDIPFGTGSVNVRLKCIGSDRLIFNCSVRTPFPFIRRVQSTASAAPTSTFFGSNPRSAHVPPYGRGSTTATCHPAARHRWATADAAVPVPMAITSNFLVMLSSLAHLGYCPNGAFNPPLSRRARTVVLHVAFIRNGDQLAAVRL